MLLRQISKALKIAKRDKIAETSGSFSALSGQSSRLQSIKFDKDS